MIDQLKMINKIIKFELIFTCTNGTIRLDSELNVTTVPEEAIIHFDGKRTESGKSQIEYKIDNLFLISNRIRRYGAGDG